MARGGALLPRPTVTAALARQRLTMVTSHTAKDDVEQGEGGNRWRFARRRATAMMVRLALARVTAAM